LYDFYALNNKANNYTDYASYFQIIVLLSVCYERFVGKQQIFDLDSLILFSVGTSSYK